MSDTLFTPSKIGAIDIQNRIVMAPLTRSRANNSTDTPSDMAPTYYGQRASAGLIISEATQISAQGKGYISTPGIYTQDHVAAWRAVTDAVHAKGSKMICQLWHVGRISHTSLLPDGGQPVAPSAIAADAQTFTADGPTQVSDPRALTGAEIDAIIGDYVNSAKLAMEAGFDGVEVHAGNGYLLDQFIQDGSNTRDDAYGGSVENRIRIVLDILDAVGAAVGFDRVGLRLSPTGTFNDMRDSDTEGTFGALIDALNAKGLAYLHMVEEFAGSGTDESRAMMQRLRARYHGTYIANGAYLADSGHTAVQSGHADAVAFGLPYIANPDLVERFKTGAALSEPDQATMYGGDASGYIDYTKADGSPA